MTSGSYAELKVTGSSGFIGVHLGHRLTDEILSFLPGLGVVDVLLFALGVFRVPGGEAEEEVVEAEGLV